MEKQISKTGAWILASRPKTLLAAIVPVLVGAAFAFADKKFSPAATLTALFCSLCIQVGTNFTNDLYDFLKGADNTERVGPLRVLNAGLVTKKEMRNAIVLVFGSAFLAGLYLVKLGGLPILVIGILSIISGYIYTAGPYPLAYNGLGDIFSFVFFGVVGTTGTYFVNTMSWSPLAFLASIPVGTLITAILVVNNYRDIEQDAAAGKKTLAVIFGKKFTEAEYIFLIGIAYLIPVVMAIKGDTSFWIFLPFVSLPLAYKMIRLLYTLKGTELNKLLEITAKFSALFGFLFALGAIL